MRPVAALLLLALAPAAAPAASWSFEAALGSAWHADTRLEIAQAGEAPLALAADWATRPFQDSPYYALRLARWQGNRAWELSLIHDKMYLRNPPRGVAALSISHGFNLLTLNRAGRRDALTWRFGAGIVVTHVEGRVRGVDYDGPYDLAGVVALAGVSRRFYLAGPWFLNAELAATLARAEAEAHGVPALALEVRHAAVHALIGLGRDF